jgi:hypothetical protein
VSAEESSVPPTRATANLIERDRRDGSHVGRNRRRRRRVAVPELDPLPTSVTIRHGAKARLLAAGAGSVGVRPLPNVRLEVVAPQHVTAVAVKVLAPAPKPRERVNDQGSRLGRLHPRRLDHAADEVALPPTKEFCD